MFTVEQRDQVRQRVLELAQSDPRVTAGALTGSTAFGSGDRWSDIDVAFGIADGIALESILDDWTQVFKQEFGILDHFELRSGSSIYRVFLLPEGLELDVGVTRAPEFGARGPNFHLLFGNIRQQESAPQPGSQPEASSLIGLSWHHVLHARSCIARHKPWQAEYWISEIRDHVLALACLRLGENTLYARGIDRLPRSITAPLAETLVRSLDEQELRRALAVVTRCLIGEIHEWNPALCTRLSPVLQEFAEFSPQYNKQRME